MAAQQRSQVPHREVRPHIRGDQQRPVLQRHSPHGRPQPEEPTSSRRGAVSNLPKAPGLNPVEVAARNGAQAVLTPGTGEVTAERDHLRDSPQCRAMSSIKCPRLLKTRCVLWRPPFVGFVMSGSEGKARSQRTSRVCPRPAMRSSAELRGLARATSPPALARAGEGFHRRSRQARAILGLPQRSLVDTNKDNADRQVRLSFLGQNCVRRHGKSATAPLVRDDEGRCGSGAADRQVR